MKQIEQINMNLKRILVASLLVLGCSLPSALLATEIDAAQANTVEHQLVEPVALSVEALKKKVIRLNRDLFILEEDLLFPANTQFSVYVSLDTGKFFIPDSIVLKLDDQVIASHLYTHRQVGALQKGGMQRLHIGNLKMGSHELTAIAIGEGTDGREVKRAASLVFEKGSDIVSLEVRVRDEVADYQSKLDIIEWD